MTSFHYSVTLLGVAGGVEKVVDRDHLVQTNKTCGGLLGYLDDLVRKMNCGPGGLSLSLPAVALNGLLFLSAPQSLTVRNEAVGSEDL